jgi:hypothetical protein
MTTATMTRIVSKYEDIALETNNLDLAVKLNWIRNAMSASQLNLDNLLEKVLQLTILNK